MTQSIEALLNAEPNLENWYIIAQALESASDEVIADVTPKLDRWPDALRKTFYAWNMALLQGQQPRVIHLCRCLDLSARFIEDDGAVAIAQNPALRHFSVLDFTNNRIGPAGATALARSPHLGVERDVIGFDIGGNNTIRDEGFIALTEAHWLRTLKHLSVWSNKLGPRSPQTLAALPMPNLTHLNLSFSYLSASGVAALGEAEGWPQLETLELHKCGGGDRGATALANAPFAGKLHTLLMGGCHIESAGAQALAASPARLSLRELFLSRNDAIGDAGATALAGLERVENLSLERVGATDATAQAFASAEGLKALHRLTLSHNQLTGRGARALLESKALPALSRLALERNAIDAEGAKTVAAARPSRPLEQLYITTDAIGAEGNMALIQSSAIPDDQRQRSLEKLRSGELKTLAKRLKLRGYSKLKLQGLRDMIWSAVTAKP